MPLVKQIDEILNEDYDSMDVEDFGDASGRPREQTCEVVAEGHSKLRSATHKFDEDVKYLGKKIHRFELIEQPANIEDGSTIPHHFHLDFQDVHHSDNYVLTNNDLIDDSSDVLYDGDSSYDDPKDDGGSCDDAIESDDEQMNEENKVTIGKGNENGESILAQFELYDELLYCRMLEQEILVEANKLPLPTATYHQLSASLGDDYQLQLHNAKRKLKQLLTELLGLQEVLLNVDSKAYTAAATAAAEHPNDEEIISEEEGKLEPLTSNKGLLRMEDISAVLNQRHSHFEKFRNNILLDACMRVNSFTSLSSKNSNPPSSILTQIKQILTDKCRLVDRTRLLRSKCRILGNDNDENHETLTPTKTEGHSDDRVTNAEIFDDNDFYHQLLVEMTKRRTSNLRDMMVISRHWSEIGKIKKLKKNVDQKASKGRRTRYMIHKKLVSFMAPQLNPSLWSDNQRDGLFQELFKTETLKNEHTINWMFQ